MHIIFKYCYKLILLTVLFVYMPNSYLTAIEYSSTSEYIKYRGQQRYVITGNNVYLREQPNVKSTPLTKLKFGSIVYFIKTSTESVEIDGKKGKWIFVFAKTRIKVNVDRYDNKPIKGWIFDYYIAYPDMFEKVKNWEYKKEADGTIGEDSNRFFINNDGSFKLCKTMYYMTEEEMEKICNSEYGGVFDKSESICSITGHLFQYKNIIWAKFNNKNNLGYIYMYVKKDGSINVATDSKDSLFFFENMFKE